MKLAKEAYFGKDIMMKYTVRGTGSYHALPIKELSNLKEFLMKIVVPCYISSRIEFENLWKTCVESL